MSKIEEAYRTILNEVYPDWYKDENCKETPQRAEKAIIELTSGYKSDPGKLTTFSESKYNQIIAVKGIRYFSLCAHHLLPFFGDINIAIIPNGSVLGLSKYARVALHYAKRLQIQERMTEEIAEHINESIKPKGVAVLITGTHLCMAMRGVQSQNVVTETSALRGCFMDEESARAEVFKIFKG